MKRLFFILFISLIFFSCKKDDAMPVELRCGTFFTPPPWAKNFKVDSLYSLRSLIGVLYGKHSSFSSTKFDSTYNISVPIRFFPGGYGELNNNIAFRYTLHVGQSMPEVLIDPIQDLSPIFPFPTSFLTYGNAIKLRVENYSQTNGQFYLGNEKAALEHIYESSFIGFSR